MEDFVEYRKTGTYSGLVPREQFLADIYSLVQAVKIYQDNNQQVIDRVANFQRSLEKVVGDEETLDLMVENGRFYFQKEKLLLRKEAERVQANLLRYMDECDLGGLSIKATATVVPMPEVVKFASLLNSSAWQDNPAEWLAEQLAVEKLLWVAPLNSADSDDDVDLQNQEWGTPGKRPPRKVYAYTLNAVQDVVKKLSAREKVGARKAVRMVQTMVEEIVLQEKPMMMAMSTIKAYDDYTFAHSVNVAILAMYIGKSIGLPKEYLECLGLCGLFHDLGKILWPHELLNKIGNLDDEDFKMIRQHSLNSTRLIVKQFQISVKRKGKLLLPLFEHHLKYDLTGYPDMGWSRPISLYGRILAIADVYDALTSPRVYREEAMSADRALGVMLQGSGTVFDPILLKVFINMLGIYPIGTLLMLDGGELALVSQRPTSDDISRPWVFLIHPAGDETYTKGAELDLSEKDSAGGYVRKIEGSMNPVAYNIQPAEFLT